LIKYYVLWSQQNKILRNVARKMAYRELKQLNRLQLLFFEYVKLMTFCDRWKL